MSRIDELIEELCPDGVEFDDLGEVLIPRFGTRITKSKDRGSTYPVYGGGGESFRTDAFNRENEIVVSRFAMSETCVRRVHGKFWLLDSGFTFEVDETRVLHDFVGYYLFNRQLDIYACSSQGAQKNLKVKNFLKFRIPVPPLEVQREIVRVLDLFTSLEAELEAELEARRLQYEHYRDQLLTFTEGGQDVRWVTLSEIANLDYGLTTTTSDFGSTKLVRITDISDEGKFDESDLPYIDDDVDISRYKLVAGDIVVARTGATFGKSAIYDGGSNIVPASFLIRVRTSPALRSKFLWHYMQSNFYWNQARKLVKLGSQPQFSANALGRLLVPVPSVEKQARIEILLDKFDLLSSSISFGLPAEIAARRQQYEYYRDKLLTFKEKVG